MNETLFGLKGFLCCSTPSCHLRYCSTWWHIQIFAAFNTYETKKKQKHKNTRQFNLITRLPCPLNILFIVLPLPPPWCLANRFCFLFFTTFFGPHLPSSPLHAVPLLRASLSHQIKHTHTHTHTKTGQSGSAWFHAGLKYCIRKKLQTPQQSEATPRVSGRRAQQQQRRGCKQRTRCLAAGYIYYWRLHEGRGGP